MANKDIATRLTESLHSFFVNHSLQNQQIWLAYSGGMDSTVLLHLLKSYLDGYQDLTLKAIHIDHQLNAESAKWAQHCQNVCSSLGIDLTICRCNNIQSEGKGLEQAARQQRYQFFNEIVAEGEVLFLAHHLRDQSETMLFRLIRGSGLKGLAAMNEWQKMENIIIARPLLETPFEDILDFAENKSLFWVEDPSNIEIDFDRNFLRNKILMPLRKRWPHFDQGVFRSTQLSQEQSGLLEELAQMDASKIELKNNCVKLNSLLTLSQQRIANLLSWWLAQNQLPMIDRKRFTSLYQQLLSLKSDTHFHQKIGAYELACSQGWLMLIPDWLLNSTHLQFDNKLTEVQSGIKILLENEKFKIEIFIHKSLMLHFEIDKLTIKFCENLKAIKSSITGKHIKLKNLFQQHQVPVWFRRFWPLIYENDKLILIPGLKIITAINSQNDESTTINEKSETEIINLSRCCLYWGNFGHFEI